jgi:polysaccharide biosynthesis transport protein
VSQNYVKDGIDMQSQFSRYLVLAKRWAWVVVLGVVVCGGGTYVVSKRIHPVYQASAFMILTMGGASNTSAYDNTSASLEAVLTYSQLVTNPIVLNPVVAKHPGLTLNQLTAMIAVKPQSNTQIIELDAQNTDPQLAAGIANEVSGSFAQYVNSQLPAAVQILPAVLPTTPISPKPLPFAGLGALAGLGLALALIVIFEWVDDRPGSSEEVQQILGLDPLAILPRRSRRYGRKRAEDMPVFLAEGYHMLCASLNAACAGKHLKGVMVTSALADEGKTTVAVNLASFLAMAGKRVLLVDADLRRPALHRHFQLDNQRGLTSAFVENWTQLELDDQPTAIPNLRVLTAGAVHFNAAELLQSSMAEQFFIFFQKMPEYDYVIFDTPPLLSVADAQIVASYVQATVLVADVSKTPRKALLRAGKALRKTRTTVLGVVLNKSGWPDYGDIRQYLSETRRQARTSVALPPPPHTPPVGTGDSIAVSPGAPALSNGVDKSDTMVLPHRQKDRNERS